MTELHNHTGDLFQKMWEVKHPDNLAIVPHVCNVQGAWGAGFVLAISKQAPVSLRADVCPEKAYKVWYDYSQQPKGDFSIEAFHKKQDIEKRIEGANVSNPFELGNMQIVTVKRDPNQSVSDIKWSDGSQYYEVVNMLAQDGFIGKNGDKRPLRYAALVQCMLKIKDIIHLRRENNSATFPNGEIHCPEFGAGLGGGDWNIIEELIHEIWVDKDIDVHVYRLA